MTSLRLMNSCLPILVSIVLLGPLLACDAEIEPITAPSFIEVAPTSMDFGGEPLKNSVRKELIIRNLGHSKLDLKSIKLRGQTGAFSIKNTPGEVEPNDKKSVIIEFTPLEVEDYFASLIIESDANNKPIVQVELKGKGVDNIVCGDCNMPPSNQCISETELEVFDLIGSCVNDECKYQTRIVICDQQCLNGSCNNNQAPTVTSAITPAQPSTTDDLTVNSTTMDPNEDMVTLRFEWAKNGTTVASETTSSIASNLTSKGDEWVVSVTPNDGQIDGLKAVATTIIVNSPPVASTVSISPNMGIETTVFTCTAGAGSDLDGDVVTFKYQWMVNQQASVQTTTITGANFSHGDVIHCMVTPNDSESDGLSISSSTVGISNYLPSITSVSLTPIAPDETSTVRAIAAGWSDLDGDPPRFLYEWYIDGMAISTGDIIDGRLFDRGDRLEVVLTPIDDFGQGPAVRSSPVTVVNSPGQISGVTLTPNPGRQTSTALLTRATDDLDAAAYGWSDADGDPAGFEYAWLINTATVVSQTTASLGNEHYVRGDQVVARVWPYDGRERGAYVDSPTVVIANTPPEIPCTAPCPPVTWPCACLNATLSPREGNRTTTITCIPAGWADIDGDPSYYTYQWFVNGTRVGATSQFYPEPYAQLGDLISCSITPFDGFEVGNSVYTLDFIVENAPPTAPTATITPSLAATSQDLNCSVIVPSTDADNDSVTYSYSWTDGVTTQTGQTLLSSLTSANDTWTCTITPNDGTADGPAGSASIIIQSEERCSLVFDGSSTYVDMGSLNLNHPLTMEAWVKPYDLNAYQTLMSNTQFAGCSIQFNDCVSSPGTSRFCGVYYANGLSAVNSSPVTASAWIHVASVYDGSEIRIYVNGVHEGTSAASGAILSSGVNFLVGAEPQPNAAGGRESYFNGEISEVRLSSAVRYTADFTPPNQFTSDTQTIRLWKFDEGQGNVANDSSSNSQSGTIYNGSWNNTCAVSNTICINGTLWDMSDVTAGTPCLGQYYQHATALSVCQGLGTDWSLPTIAQADALLATMSSTEQLNAFPLHGNGGTGCTQTQAGLNGVWWLSDHNGSSAGSAIFCNNAGCYTTGTTMGDIYYYMVRCVRNGC